MRERKVLIISHTTFTVSKYKHQVKNHLYKTYYVNTIIVLGVVHTLVSLLVRNIDEMYVHEDRIRRINTTISIIVVLFLFEKLLEILLKVGVVSISTSKLLYSLLSKLITM